MYPNEIYTTPCPFPHSAAWLNFDNCADGVIRTAGEEEKKCRYCYFIGSVYGLIPVYSSYKEVCIEDLYIFFLKLQNHLECVMDYQTYVADLLAQGKDCSLRSRLP